MFEVVTALSFHAKRIKRDWLRMLLTKRFFYRRGRRPPKYNWLLLYKAIQDFKILFRFNYDLKSGLLRAKFIPRNLRWFAQMRFLQFYLRLLRRIRWYELPMRRIFFFLQRAKRLCYLGLIRQKNRLNVYRNGSENWCICIFYGSCRLRSISNW